MDPKILSEYLGDNKTASVSLVDHRFQAQGFVGGVLQVTEMFDSESDAEDFCEDWVLLSTPQ